LQQACLGVFGLVTDPGTVRVPPEDGWEVKPQCDAAAVSEEDE